MAIGPATATIVISTILHKVSSNQDKRFGCKMQYEPSKVLYMKKRMPGHRHLHHGARNLKQSR